MRAFLGSPAVLPARVFDRCFLTCRQDFANWCLTACIIVATAVVAAVAEPHQVPYVIWGEPGCGYACRRGEGPHAK